MNTGKTWVSIIKKRQLSECVVGASKAEAVCVVDDARLAQYKEEDLAFEAAYKADELYYRHLLNLQLAEELERHGGSKVE